MRALTAGLVLMMIASATFGAENENGWYAGVTAGPSGLHNTCNVAETVGAVSACDDESVAFKILFGREFPGYLGMEISFTDAGEARVDGATAGTDQLIVHPRILMAAATFRLPVSKRGTLFAKAGVTYFDTDFERKGAFLSLPDGADGIKTALGAGLDVRIWEHFSARLEWDNYNDVSVGKGDVDMLTAGVIFNF